MARRCLIAIPVLVLAAGCLWRGYASIMSVHLDVLTGMADKLSSLAQADRGPGAEGMAEYVYPAKRGRTFLRQFDGDTKRQSYRQFGDFLDRYERLVGDVDKARALGKPWKGQAPHIEAERVALAELAARIRQLVQRGD
jgi:hypothetical protein